MLPISTEGGSSRLEGTQALRNVLEGPVVRSNHPGVLCPFKAVVSILVTNYMVGSVLRISFQYGTQSLGESEEESLKKNLPSYESFP